MIITVNVEMTYTIAVDTDDPEEAKEQALELLEEALQSVSTINPVDFDSEAEWCECDDMAMCAYEGDEDE